MFNGQLVAIYLSAHKRAELQRVDRVDAVAGRGLSGDRYFRRKLAGTTLGNSNQEVTLIELESIERARGELQIDLQPGQARRNLITQGVPLNDLVGRQFVVGEVMLRGLELCEPCKHLESLTVAGIMKTLCHRGGLRAEILEGGVLRTGDAILLRE